jgi:putative pyoverdin transport system ATP-binding/permease protein
MNLIQFVWRTCRRPMLWMALAALLGGACNAGLIAAMNAAMHQAGPATTGIVIAFIALGIGRLLTSLLSQMMSVDFSQGAIADLRRSLVRAILGAPLRQLEETGSARLIVALTDDVYNVTQALSGIPICAVNVALLLGGAAYLGWLSWQMLLGLTALAFLGAIGQRFFMRGAYRSLTLARVEEEHLFGHFRALIEGIKELKLHRNRRGAFLSRDITEATRSYERHNVEAENRFILAQHWSHLLFYVLIGVLLFAMPLLGEISKEALTGYIITALYLMGPLAGVLTAFPLFGRANVALQQIERIGMSLSTRATEPCLPESGELKRKFRRLELAEVTHSYFHEKDDSYFTLGPISLTFRPGELVFLVGGNGSGKSTLAKIITGLYPPEAGAIRLDGELVTDRNRDEYRQLFSAVFADFHVFPSLLGLENSNLDAQAHEYLSLLHLDHKVTVRDGVFSTTALSQGQRKRLALLTAYLEDRPFYLFDEWASDQDPQFKHFFYTQLLPDLKTAGKGVLVITHDDKYFHLADRVVKLDYGRLVEEDGISTGRFEPVEHWR